MRNVFLLFRSGDNGDRYLWAVGVFEEKKMYTTHCFYAPT